MLSTVLRYEIETIPHDGRLKWRIRKVIHPDYDLINETFRRRFLWWTWERPYIVIFNERKARIKARKKAFRIANRLYPAYLVRVFVIFQFPEVDDPIRHCIWANGHYYSTH